MKPTYLLSTLIALLLSCVSIAVCAEPISLKFNNNLDETIYITTSQFGGDPSIIEQQNLTKKIEIKKHSSKQVFLFDDAPWLMWSASIQVGESKKIVDQGRKKLNKAVQKHIVIDIEAPSKKQPIEKNATPLSVDTKSSVDTKK